MGFNCSMSKTYYTQVVGKAKQEKWNFQMHSFKKLSDFLTARRKKMMSCMPQVFTRLEHVLPS